MKQRYLIIAVLVLCAVLITGCALLNKAMPSQLDEAGNPIPGTHQATEQITNAVAGINYNGMPVGQIAIGALLLVWNGWERFKAAKSGKGLNATLLALKQISKDPALKSQWETIQPLLASAHKAAGVKSTIDVALAKL
jgi:hypothetical protein